MNFEGDDIERLAWAWDGQAQLRATRGKWLGTMYGDFAVGRFDRIAAVMGTPRRGTPPPVARRVPAPVAASSAPPVRNHAMYDVITNSWRPQGARQEPWSARSAAKLGLRFAQPGDPDFVPSTALQAYEHRRALGG
jgi:hypothetical protein